MPTNKAKKQNTKYNERELCKDIAAAELTFREMAQKHKISASAVYSIARGAMRPELKAEIDGLVEAAVDESRRLFKSRALHMTKRLLKIADGEVTNISMANLEISLKAALKCLEFAGLSSELSATVEGSKLSFSVRYR